MNINTPDNTTANLPTNPNGCRLRCICTRPRILLWLGFIFILAEGLSWLKLTLDPTLDPFQVEIPPQSTLYAHPEMAADPYRNAVLHPYLGFVLDPQQKYRSAFSQRWLTVNSLGFLGDLPPKKTTPQKANEQSNEVSIVILGGSAAAELFLRAQQTLIQQLKTYPRFQDKTIRLYSLALPGYHQPQPLLALNYVLALGYSFDIVINLDGIGEITGGLEDHPPQQPATTAFFYPQHWAQYAAKAIEPEQLALAGQKQLLTKHLADYQNTLKESGLANSHFITLLWAGYIHIQQNRLQALEAARQQLAATRQAFSYQITGPDTPDQADALLAERVKLWEQSSRQLWKLANGLGMAYYHFLQPGLFVENAKRTPSKQEAALLEAKGIQNLQEFSRYQSAIEQGYPLLIEKGQQMASENAPFMNITQLFKYQPQTTYTGCCYYTQLGYDWIATKIAKTIGL